MSHTATTSSGGSRRSWADHKAWTIVIGFVVIAFALVTVPMLTRLPVVSIGALLSPLIFTITLVAFVLLAIAVLLAGSHRTVARVAVAAVATIAFVSTAVMSGSTIAFAGNYGVGFTASDILPSAPSNLDADAEVDQYTTFEGKDVGLSVWEPTTAPEGDELAPVLVWVHGGAWTKDTRFTPGERSNAAGFADLGYMVVSVDYSTSDADHQNWDIQEGQVACALVWVAEHAEEYGGDANRLLLGGASAGGNIAFNVGAKVANGQLASSCGGDVPEVDAMTIVVGASSPASVWNDSDPLLQPLLHPELTKHLGGSPNEYPERYASMESAKAISASTPPTLWMYGSNDHIVPRESSDNMMESLREGGVTVEQMVVPFASHAANAGIVETAWRAETVRFAADHGVTTDGR